ncbi:MAG: RNase adapter RapZ [Dokdonella sp.]|uniref:RNase adapter RapZ n=3 Tax=Dokdonella sp. TaxID=2291710 RepID=UPI002C631859|nr:RNase adapter RapZ [Dokdonella sp.]HOX70267.1 RNase adapter RapZ [Dokdonella sp.]HPG94880.1 RNase adapter RapZ [Dokdonella sp.]
MNTPASNPGKTRLIVVSGLSGSGKSVALRTLEDLDYYCVDNLPSALMPAFVRAVSEDAGGLHPRLAVGVDVRNRADDLNRLPSILASLAEVGISYELVFLDTRDDVLIKRYSETRRRHPLSADGLGLADAIALERKLMRQVVAIADRVIDTSELNVHQLRRLVIAELGMTAGSLTLLFESFAYKRGVPPDADFVFDARCLPNPHWNALLRPLSGRDAPVREWLEAQADVNLFLEHLRNFLDIWLSRFRNEGRSYVTICIGCTGGRHRSVHLVERLAEYFRQNYERVLSYHRELE